MEVSGKRADITEVGAAEELEELCEICEVDHVTTKANGICRECEQFMCNTCFRHHLKVKSCRQHVLEDTKQFMTPIQRSSENVENCKRHANENIKFYCRKHEAVGCGDCMIPKHVPCRPENIKDLSKQFHKNKDFESLMRNLEDLSATNNENNRKVQENKKANQVMLEKALKEINSFRSEINTYLDKAEASIIKDAKDKERNDNKILAKLEKDCKLLSSRITDVRQKLDKELYHDSALFIQTVDCKPRVLEIEREVSRIQRENDIRTFEFMPDKQLQDIVTSIEKLGSFGKNETKSPKKPVMTRTTKEVSRESTAGHWNQREPVKETKEKDFTDSLKAHFGWPGGGWDVQMKARIEQAEQIAVGARVRPIGDFASGYYYYQFHNGQQRTLTAVNPNGTVNVKWDATGETWPNIGIGIHVELM